MKKRRRLPVARSINGVIFGLKTPDRYANSSQRTNVLDDLRPTHIDEVPKPELPSVRGTKSTLVVIDDISQGPFDYVEAHSSQAQGSILGPDDGRP